MERRTDLRKLVDDWIEFWNSRNLDRIMGHYDSEVVFEAKTVVRRWGRADGILRGVAELRQHFRLGLEKAPELHFDLEEVFTAPGAALYRRDNGNRVLDVVRLNDCLKAIAVTAFYREDQP